MYNKDMILAERQMRNLLEQLDNAEVTVLSARLDMDYSTPRPHPFQFHIQAWGDSNFREWSRCYWLEESERQTTVPFGYGEVFSLRHD